LLLASYIFYGWAAPQYVLLLIFYTAATFIVGIKIERSDDRIARKWWLVIGIFINLGVLGYFKYFGAQALAWTWYLLSLHPAVEAKLRDELRVVLGQRVPSYEDLASLRYTRMVIEESMRLYPPAHTMAREPIIADHILGHRIPVGALVLIVPWLLHRKPSLWESRSLRSGTIFARACSRPSTLRLYSVWGWSTHLHWCGICHDGGSPYPSHDRPALSPASNAGPSRRTSRPDHTATTIWTQDDFGTPAIDHKR
jgi:hypothetical protein